MYPRWIEVHDGMEPMSVNCDNIEYVADGTISMKDSEIKVLESYDELKALIMDAGYSIHKADPRLDVSHPLTMEDLKDMMGEPVWESNALCWYLVFENENGELWMRRSTGSARKITDDDLVKFPLYRMRHDD